MQMYTYKQTNMYMYIIHIYLYTYVIHLSYCWYAYILISKSKCPAHPGLISITDWRRVSLSSTWFWMRWMVSCGDQEPSVWFGLQLDWWIDFAESCRGPPKSAMLVLVTLSNHPAYWVAYLWKPLFIRLRDHHSGVAGRWTEGKRSCFYLLFSTTKCIW